MKIALAQLNYHIGNFSANTEKIKSTILRAKEEGADLVVFSELSVCGYPPRDFLEFPDFIRRCEDAVKEIASVCVGISAIVGAPAINSKPEGKNLFNAAYVLSDGQIKSIHHKALLPTYDVFDEYRYFEPAKEFHIAEINGKKIALTICEDLWDVEDDLMYTLWPMEELIRQQPDFMINIAASPFSYTHPEMRRNVLKRNVEKYNLPLFYLQHVGAQTELIFDGGSMVMNSQGEIVGELKYFAEDFQIFDLEEVSQQSADRRPQTADRKRQTAPSLIHDAIVLGIKDYFSKMGFSKAILGLSGGVDSALVLVLAVRALGKENVLSVLMPSEFSSSHSVDDSIALCKNLDCKYEIVPIKEGFDTMEKTLAPVFKDQPFSVAEENIQARLRAVILMGIANKFGYILLNTTNKSEAAVGYGTLYGDMCGGISVIGDVYKTQVYELCQYINSEKSARMNRLDGEIIPGHILTKAPSAELRPNQKDSDSLPDYSILDKILFEYIEHRQGPKELVEMGFEKNLVDRILKLVNSNEWKRAQFAPVLRVSQKAFGSGRRMPIVGKYLG
jgi:NAD+ synthase (glutamine-hydrolysing)